MSSEYKFGRRRAIAFRTTAGHPAGRPSQRLHHRLPTPPHHTDGGGHRCDQRARGGGARLADRQYHQPRLLPSTQLDAGVAGRQPPRLVGRAGADGRRAHHRPDGALRLGEDPRPRHPRGDGGDPHRPKPDERQSRGAEAAVLGDLDRHRRSVRRRGPDHHDRRRVGLAVRPGLSSLGRGAEDAARRRRGAGMAAIFATPVAAVLLAVELLLFEWKPRSFMPVRSAAVVAAAVRVPLLGRRPDLPGHAASGARRGRSWRSRSPSGITRRPRVGRAYARWSTASRISSPSCRFTGCGGRSSAACSSASAAWSHPRALGVGYDTIRDLLPATSSAASCSAC